MSQLPHPFNDPSYEGLVFMAEYSVHQQATLLWIARNKFEGGQYVGVERAQLVWEDSDGSRMPEPTIVCRDRDTRGDDLPMQHLFNCLWGLGFRPPGSAPTENLVATKDAHLADLRKILFNQLGIKQ